MAAALGLAPAPDTEAGLREMTAAIRTKLTVATVVVHPRECAACATADGTWWVPGPVAEHPLITTGAVSYTHLARAGHELENLRPFADTFLREPAERQDQGRDRPVEEGREKNGTG